jgi:hypothetical protein
MPADLIAEQALDRAHQQGRIAELGRQMEVIQRREGLGPDECCLIGDGPEDYQQLSNESEELYDKVHDTVFTTVLRRYHLGAVADLYETDRPKFDRLSERARKKIFEGKA